LVATVTDRLSFYESVFGRGRLSGNGINFDVRCPICAPNDPSKKKLSIRTTDDANHCWTCGWKSRGLAPLLRKYGTQDQLIAYRLMCGVDRLDMSHDVVDVQPLTLPADFQLIATSNESDPDVKAARRYLISRGLDERDEWYFKLGLSAEPRWYRRIIMPSFDASGKLNYFTARAFDRNKKPKYDNPDVDKNPVIFNELNIDWSRRLTLVEGPFDLVKCPENSTALLGSDLDERHEIFNKILLNGTPVALSLDGDMWLKKTPRLVKRLQEYNIDVVVVDVRPWGDPGSMSKAEFETALSEARPLQWNDTFLDRLDSIASASIRLF